MAFFPSFCTDGSTPGHSTAACRLMPVVAMILLLAAIVFTPACGPKEGKPPSSKRNEKEAQKIRQTLVKRYDPVVFPAHLFSKRKVITYNLQKMLISTDRKPVLFEGYLDDITKEGQRFEIHFQSSFAYGPTVTLLDKRRVMFHLRCDYESIRSVLENPPELEESFNGSEPGDKDFFVVCQVWNVRKVTSYSAEGYAEGEKVNSAETPDRFSVHGKLLEIVAYPKLTD